MAISAELGSVLESVVDDLVANGRYNSKSEVLREGVRLVQEREARLKHLTEAVALGFAELDAGQGLPAEDVFAELEARYRSSGR